MIADMRLPLLSRQKVWIRFVFLAISFVVPVDLSGQPNPPPPLEVLVEQLQPTLDALAYQIAKNPRDVVSLSRRAEIYKSLYDRAIYHRKPSRTFADLALADLSKAIEVNPSPDSYNARARWHMSLWQNEPPRSFDKIEVVVDYYLDNEHFAAAKSDLLNSIRLDKSNDNLVQGYGSLGNLHARRAQGLAKPAEIQEVRTRGATYLLWEDFDTAIDYAKKLASLGRTRTQDWPKYYRENVGSVYADKGRAAVDLGDFELALAAFEAGAKYVDPNYIYFCPFYASWAGAYLNKGMPVESIEILSKALTDSPWSCRFLLEQRAGAYVVVGNIQKAVDDYTTRLGQESSSFAEIHIKRGKLYLDLGDPYRAREDLDYAIDQAYSLSCPQPFLLRAQAHRQLGNIDLATKDEVRAASLPVGKGTSNAVTCLDP